MTNKNHTQFNNYSMALLAMQQLSTYFALQGFHVEVSIYSKQYGIDCTVFHDEKTTLLPPTGYIFTSVKEVSVDGRFWTKFAFDCKS